MTEIDHQPAPLAIKREFFVERQGKDFVLYAGLLDAAHQQGLRAIRTAIVQLPTQENRFVAVCTAMIVTERGTFTGIGDASPENVSKNIAAHLLRMAETRAKARALRDAVNIGTAALEELGDEPQAEPATEKQIAFVSSLANQRGWKPGNLESECQLRFDHGLADLTKDEASKLIKELKEHELAPEDRPEVNRPRPSPAPQAQTARTAVPTAASGNPNQATPAQVRAIYLIARDRHGISEADIDAQCEAAYNCLPAELSRKQASEFISGLQGGEDQGKR